MTWSNLFLHAIYEVEREKQLKRREKEKKLLDCLGAQYNPQHVAYSLSPPFIPSQINPLLSLWHR
jgi:hypothetical protein